MPSRGHTHKQPHSKTCSGACSTFTFCSQKRKKKKTEKAAHEGLRRAEHTLRLPYQKKLEAGTCCPEEKGVLLALCRQGQEACSHI